MATAPPLSFWLSSSYMRQSAFVRTSRQLQLRWKGTQHACNGRSDALSERLRHRRTFYENTPQRMRSSSTASQPPSPYSPQQVYHPPTTGLVSRLPSTWIPYAELIRLDKPAGTLYLFAPCLFSTLLAASLTPTPPLAVLGTSALFLTGALIMRSAGCTINDLWDRDLDKDVARTRLRPIARGAITVRQAVPFLGLQLLTGLAVLLQLPPSCFFYATPSLLLVTLYPLAKRITHYPQFILGLTFSWGAIMGFPALGISLLSHTPALLSAACLYGSCVAWTLIYDMIYAYQDIRDDAAAGIKSIALARQGNAKAFMTAVAAVQVGLLAGAGWSVGAGPVFFVASCGGAAATLEHMIRVVRLESVEDCAQWFRNGVWVTGGVIAVGLLGEYAAQWMGLYEGTQWGRKKEDVVGETA